jgi:uncharacterized protein (DUF2141 family)
MKLRASMSLSVLLLGAAVTVGRGALADGAPSSDRANVRVSVAGLRSDRGAVRCIAYDGPERFPEGNQRVIARVSARPSGASATCEFAGLPRGRDVAVVIHHDENDDHVFQRGVFGIPLEGYGFSNDARPVLAAPSFDACKFRPLGERWSVRITARY